MSGQNGGGGSGEVVVITGASAGVGRATAREFARHGARIGLVARGLEGLNATRLEVEALGGRALVLPADVAVSHEIDVAARVVAETWGGIDVWINGAMTSVFSPVKQMTSGDFSRVTEVTYLGTVYGTLAALRHMLPRDRGVVVQVGSALAYRSVPLQAAYCAAKRAVIGFSDSLRTELLHDGSHVRITTVNLPAMNTPQFDWVRNRLPRRPRPVAPIYQPEVGARALYWAAHNDRREVDVGLPTVGASLGEKIAPGLLDRYLARAGYDLQQQPEPADPRRPFNLWEPVRGDHGAHGSFGRRVRSRSLQLWADTHRGLLAAGTLGVAAAALVGVRLARGGKR
jgi:NAD(P)-dependent dehydrogenase (short-subunit alcohol dehydrogenase family)